MLAASGSAMLRVTGLGASNLARADRRSLSDPYFVLKLDGAVLHVSTTMRNEHNPVWEANQ